METRILERAIKWAEKCASRDDYWNDISGKLWRVNEFLSRCGLPKLDTESIESPCGKECHYLNTGETYENTVLADENEALSVGSWGDWLEEHEAAYCENEGVIKCGCCGGFPKRFESDWHNTECECGHYVDGTPLPEIGSQLSNCRELFDYDSERAWASNGTLPTHATKSRQTHLVVRVQYTEQYDSEWAETSGRYCVGVLAVNPGIIHKKELTSMLSSCGVSDSDWKEADIDEKLYHCLSYGTYATLWEEVGDCLSNLLKRANEELTTCQIVGGFKLDQPQNAIGSTGWEFMAGDILGGLKKYS